MTHDDRDKLFYGFPSGSVVFQFSLLFPGSPHLRVHNCFHVGFFWGGVHFFVRGFRCGCHGGQTFKKRKKVFLVTGCSFTLVSQISKSPSDECSVCLSASWSPEGDLSGLDRLDGLVLQNYNSYVMMFSQLNSGHKLVLFCMSHFTWQQENIHLNMEIKEEEINCWQVCSRKYYWICSTG